ncbi:chymotrypsin-1 [Tribolium castaneum]|uniref:Serine protease H158 n=1 Tax=Tribolium castaneum TaxID=7070 RepID=D2A4L5_TRICA|nr:PREDICTED: chymotrypsin-1 [Tribolium castaneum]EFA05718.1 serine protease H158 [Tribolium castaneum]|eukprot:XP_008194478.1 PREDICTED: chymotrypsin-1 [Tribolium castaneum]
MGKFCVICLFVFVNVASSRLTLRMLGGVNTNGTIPYIASIKHLKNNEVIKSCLGSVISNQWVLTSGFCLLGGDPDTIFVDVGVYSHSDVPPKRYKSTQIEVHPDFDSTTGQNDIALIRTESNVLVASIQLGHFSKNVKKLTAFGWNENDKNDYSKPEPYHLGRLDLEILSMEDCQKKFHSSVKLDEKQICGYGGKGKDMCGVDFGGPLVDGTGRQVGVFNDVIFAASGKSHQCHSHHNHPLVFTKVEAYAKWICETANIYFFK